MRAAIRDTLPRDSVTLDAVMTSLSRHGLSVDSPSLTIAAFVPFHRANQSPRLNLLGLSSWQTPGVVSLIRHLHIFHTTIPRRWAPRTPSWHPLRSTLFWLTCRFHSDDCIPLPELWRRPPAPMGFSISDHTRGQVDQNGANASCKAGPTSRGGWADQDTHDIRRFSVTN